MGRYGADDMAQADAREREEEPARARGDGGGEEEGRDPGRRARGEEVAQDGDARQQSDQAQDDMAGHEGLP